MSSYEKIKNLPMQFWVKLIFVLLIFFSSFFALRSNLTYGLSIPSIEIKNDCSGKECKRNFSVSIYMEGINRKLGAPRRQGVVEKIAGVTPEIFKYKLKFINSSFVKIWSGQSSEVIHSPPLDNCPFPEDFEKTKYGGFYKGEFVLVEEIPTKIEKLATALNDCPGMVLFLQPDDESIEITEKYNVFIILGLWSYVSLGVLSFFVTVLIISAYKILSKFILIGISG